MNKTVIVVMKKNCRAVGENTTEEYNQLNSSDKLALGKLYLRSKEWGVSSARKERKVFEAVGAVDCDSFPFPRIDRMHI